MAPHHFTVALGAMTVRLRQTKTTGIGKKVKFLPVFIPATAHLMLKDWLTVGYTLLNKVAPEERDNLIPRFSRDMTVVSGKPASPSDLAAMSEVVLQELRVVSFDVTPHGGYKSLDERLLHHDAVSCWSGHSERSTIVSALAALGFKKERRDQLGRWSPKGSDEYIRTYRKVVTDLVGSYVDAAVKWDAGNEIGEWETFELLRKSLQKKGYDDGKLTEVMADLVQKSEDSQHMLSQ